MVIIKQFFIPAPENVGDFRLYYLSGDILFLALRSQCVFISPLLEMQCTANSKYFGSSYEASSPTEEMQATWAMIGLCPSVSNFTLTTIKVSAQGETFMGFVNCFIALNSQPFLFTKQTFGMWEYKTLSYKGIKTNKND